MAKHRLNTSNCAKLPTNLPRLLLAARATPAPIGWPSTNQRPAWRGPMRRAGGPGTWWAVMCCYEIVMNQKWSASVTLTPQQCTRLPGPTSWLVLQTIHRFHNRFSQSALLVTADLQLRASNLEPRWARRRSSITSRRSCWRRPAASVSTLCSATNLQTENTPPEPRLRHLRTVRKIFRENILYITKIFFSARTPVIPAPAGGVLPAAAAGCAAAPGAAAEAGGAGRPAPRPVPAPPAPRPAPGAPGQVRTLLPKLPQLCRFVSNK